MGIGLRLTRLVRPMSSALPVLLGTTLPDLLDKPLYYLASVFTGRTSTDIGLISCTRTLGHSALFLLFFLSMSFFTKARKFREILLCLSLGIFTHHLLDFFQDAFISEKPFLDGAEMYAFFFPLYKDHFGAMPTRNMGEHLQGFLRFPSLFVGEFVGAALLFIDWKRFKSERSKVPLLRARLSDSKR